MVGERLHDYDLSLCNYVLGNIRQYLDRPAFARWANRMVSPPALRDYLLRSDVDPLSEEKWLLLNDEEFDALEFAFADGPLENDRAWRPYNSLHERYTETVKEVRDGLARRVADRWDETCHQFIEQLEGEGLSLSEGIRIVHEWVQRLRLLLRSLQADEYLPRPEWQSPTPSTLGTPTQAPPELADPRYAGLNARRIEAIQRMREAIKGHPQGSSATPGGLIRGNINNSDGRQALRWLEMHEGYKGFARKPRRPEQRPDRE